MKIVGEVIEHLMGDSYHSVYNQTGKGRKISDPLILGELAAKKGDNKIDFAVYDFKISWLAINHLLSWITPSAQHFVRLP